MNSFLSRLPLRTVAAILMLLSAMQISRAADVNPPLKPAGADGKPLNFDFETGTLKDWTATGNAFSGQPMRGDTVAGRRNDMRAGLHGDYWVGSYEVLGDDATGTLTSAAFKVTHRWASFLVGGGHWPTTRVELSMADDNKAFFKVSGHDDEEMQPVVVDLEKQLGKEIIIRLVDDQKGPWGHINFDNFAFYENKPEFKNELKPGSELVHALPPPDVYKYAGISPEKAAEVMTMPEGFKAQAFAGEPDIVQPIAFTMDARGRLWVAEGNTYPRRAPEGQGKDRIIVFEDETGAGHFTKRTVFYEGLNLVSGIEVGFGGVWVGAAPYLMFIPTDLNADTPKPTGKPEILLDGFGYQDTHETLNTFCWGPDGWLYGCHGVFTQSYVGKPGTPRDQRVHINACVFRYHPTRHIFERFSEGTSNPWGVDFDDKGQCIIEACVIPHLWHMIQGAHYQRQGGQHDNPYVFDDIKTIADHLHWASNSNVNQWAANGHSGALGGGHAHAGMMVYLGGSWPTQFVGQYFMNNIHGARINMDIPEAKGSGFVGHHGKDFILFNDLWSQIVNLRYDQDGSVYMIDWYDKIQCHTTDPNAPDRSNGRIFKIVYGDTKTTKVDLSKLSDVELAGQALNPHEWMVRESRHVLQERAAIGKIDPAAVEKLVGILQSNPDESRQLRALWALHCIGGLSKDLMMKELSSDKPYVAAWTIQLLCEDKNPPAEAIAEFAKLAKTSTSPVVRLYLSAALQRMPEDSRWDTITALLAHSEDANDHNLPLMNWYALEPLCAKEPQRALSLAAESKLPRILTFAVRRVGAAGGPATDALVAELGKLDDAPRQLEVLNGIRDSLQGRRVVPMPAGWKDLEPTLTKSADGAIRVQARALAVTFGSAQAIADSRRILMDAKAPAPDRLAALDSLVGIKNEGLAPLLQSLLGDADIRGAALRGLAGYDDAGTPAAVLKAYPTLDPSERKDALSTLASRAAFARELLSAIEAGTVPSRDVSADIVRQLRTLNDKAIDARVVKVWGVLRDSPADKKKRIAQLKSLVNAAGKAPDLSHGRLLFTKTCMQCHTLYGEGGHVGPDLTGSNRSDLDYILENVVDPNAIIPADYRTTQIQTTDDRTILGIVKKEDGKSLTIVMPNQDLVLPKAEIKTRKLSALSMMPEGLVDVFPDQDIRDLIAYLRAREQVALPKDATEKK
ncbi:MAG TPA: PVC-type heme-binding CxxCH protein [Tepidisphaeraceae bacterium]|jgi:putative membrane-bound dehydrogenase-like protein|nr:PVC-type heme-binding CxxCH protein [Tepidisphaeraceae bacterium]